MNYYKYTIEYLNEDLSIQIICGLVVARDMPEAMFRIVADYNEEHILAVKDLECLNPGNNGAWTLEDEEFVGYFGENYAE